MLKTDDIYPSKTGISVHFSILFMCFVYKNESNIQYTTDVTMGNALLYSKREHLLLYTDIWKVSQAEDKSGSSDIGVTLLPLRGALITATYPGRCPGLCTAAPSGRKITSCEYCYTTSAMKSTYLHHAAICHHSEYRMNPFFLISFILIIRTKKSRKALNPAGREIIYF